MGGPSSVTNGRMSNGLPVSDSNITTSNQHGGCGNDLNHAAAAPILCDLDEPEDLNMAVAAALGVEDLGMGEDAGAGNRHLSNAMHNRLNAKPRLNPPAGSGSGGQFYPSSNPHLTQLGGGSGSIAALGDINRSIEKMSINSAKNGLPPPPSYSAATEENKFRRDSGWTSSNSTEGYGSMRSGSDVAMNSGSRRCSELSQASNFSTRAMRNSPWGDHPSAASSRRSSMAGGGQVNGPQQHQVADISHQLNRLHQKAVGANPLASSVQATPNPAMSMDGRQSAMSDCGSLAAHHPSGVVHPGQGQPQPPRQPVQYNQTYNNGQNGAMRRASDPVRMGGQMPQNAVGGGALSRHRSFNQLAGTANRVPLHGQQVRGMSQQQQQFHGSAQNGMNQVRDT